MAYEGGNLPVLYKGREHKSAKNLKKLINLCTARAFRWAQALLLGLTPSCRRLQFRPDGDEASHYDQAAADKVLHPERFSEQEHA